MFGLKFKEPFCEKIYTCTDKEGLFLHTIYERDFDPVKEVFLFGIFGIFIGLMTDALLLQISIGTIHYCIIYIFFVIFRLCTIVEKEVRTIPNNDGTGPREDSTGPRDGHRAGKGRGTGAGAGSKTGGKQGDCE